MNRVHEVTKELKEEIIHSAEYIRYQDARQQIARYPMLKKRADEFRKRNFDLQNSSADIFAEADNLRQEYAYITENEMVWEYLEAEGALCRIIQHINWSLMQDLNFDVGFEDR